MYPTGYLLNTATNRYHPISFRPSPAPSEDHAQGGLHRYKSIGHHAEGFDTLELAQEWVKNKEHVEDARVVWGWDGIEVPAMIEWFIKKATKVA